MRKELKPGEALVDYFVFTRFDFEPGSWGGKRLAATVLLPDKAQLVDLGDFAEIEKPAARFRETTGNPLSGDAHRDASVLRRLKALGYVE